MLIFSRKCMSWWQLENKYQFSYWLWKLCRIDTPVSLTLFHNAGFLYITWWRSCNWRMNNSIRTVYVLLPFNYSLLPHHEWYSLISHSVIKFTNATRRDHSSIADILKWDDSSWSMPYSIIYTDINNEYSTYYPLGEAVVTLHLCQISINLKISWAHP